MSPKVILFDIDNTLLYTGGAGSHAMNLAFDEIFGIPDGFARVEFSGRTDLWILAQGLAEHGIEGGPDKHLERLTRRYYEILPQTLAERDGYLMPGFPALLAALREAGATLGLATGNFREGARIKLEYYGLSEFFEGGGFGEESLERADVVGAAIRQVANGSGAEDVLVIGDTPHDVTSALANGVVGVGVATGKYTMQELEDSGAHQVFADFSDWSSAADALLASG
jgi:phosphoglycolate phosphatase